MRRTRVRSLLVAPLAAALLAGLVAGPRTASVAYADEVDASTTVATMTSHTPFGGTVSGSYTRTAGGWRQEITFNAPGGTGPIRRAMQAYYTTTTPAGTYWREDPGTGGIWLINARTGKAAGRVHTPWAYDRLGNELPVNLKVAGLDGELFLLQLTLPSTRDRFPVTVDPHFTWGWVTGTIYFNKQETALFAVSVGAVNTMVSFVPPPWGTILKVYAALITAQAGTAIALGQCVSVNSVGLVFRYSGSEGDGYCR
jgi:hypothetical protein